MIQTGATGTGSSLASLLLKPAIVSPRRRGRTRGLRALLKEK